ncbi:MAG TPA: C39 family peptidase [Polyangiaceae bacterium]|nr:C39 family peptidase [Polyangiaceae bacterium]
MAGIVKAEPAGGGFAGLNRIFQFVNEDGRKRETACGQAACATLLTYYRARAGDLSTLRAIEKSHPPDTPFGVLGTTPDGIEKTLKDYGVSSLTHVNDIATLKRRIGANCPVICLIQNTAGLQGLFGSAHWFVVFAYDDAGVFVTNYSPIHLKWDDFWGKWSSPLTKLPVVSFRGITTTTRDVRDKLTLP